MDNTNELKELSLEKDEKLGFGFSIIGGRGSELPPIIFDVIHNSPADKCADLHIGDVIVAVDGVRVEGLTTRQVVHQLKYARSPLTLLLRDDTEVKGRAQKYLRASADDTDHLRGAISHEDLIGIRRLIIRSTSSSSQASDDDCDSVSTPSRGQSPVKLATRSHDVTPGSRRRAEGMETGTRARHCQQPLAAMDCEDGKRGVYNSHSSLDNGVFLNGSVDHKVNPADDRTAYSLSPHTPKFETFVMTGDKIIRTSVHQPPKNKVEVNSNSKPINAVSTTTSVCPDKNHIPVSAPQLATKCSPSSPSHHTSAPVSPSRIPVLPPVTSRDAAVTSHYDAYLPPHQPTYTFLDIPPDDISVDDERHIVKPDVDVDLLPPPPDDLLTSDSGQVKVTGSQNTHHSLISQSTPMLTRRQSTDDSYEAFDTGSEAVLYSDDIHSAANMTPAQAAAARTGSLGDEETSSNVKDRPPPLSAVRCRSQENYLQSGPTHITVDFDLGESMATSLDQLTYDVTNSPQHSHDNRAPSMLAGEEARSVGKLRDTGPVTQEQSHRVDASMEVECSMNGLLGGDVCDEMTGDVDDKLHDSVPPASSSTDDQFDPYVIAMAPPSKEVDRPSAARLAKRLFNQDGFKRSDISRHLSKTNEFAQFVGEEFVKFFDFAGDTLDVALRKFLDKITLAGETQERERVLAHFSRRYTDTNPGVFNSSDACHTLTCALLLLNTDLHGQNVSRKMTLSEFIYNLADLNDGRNFDVNVLRHVFNAIKSSPLECKYDDDRVDNAEGTANISKPLDAPMLSTLNPFLEIPDPSKATEYKKGYVMRKCCLDPGSKRTSFGRRGWKMFYATLRDLVLYLHKDEGGVRRGQSNAYQNIANAIRVHHSLATKAAEYKKKQYVFRLRTADGAEYLFQTGNSKECQEWIDSINFVAATLSSPPLPSGVGAQKTFQRPLLPSSHTKLNMLDQLQHDEQQVMRLEAELTELRRNPPEKGVKLRVIQDFCEKEEYLQFELRRYKTYSFLLQAKMSAFKELSEPSLVETAIGEVDEPPSSPDLSAGRPSPSNITLRSSPFKSGSEGGERSLSDRLSYRAAIYKSDLDGS